jgi:hypothetical protein
MSDKIELLMPNVTPVEDESDFYPSSGQATLDLLPFSYDDILEFAEKFKGFELDTLEINVKGVAKTGGLTQLVVGLEGEAAMTVTLKKNR